MISRSTIIIATFLVAAHFAMIHVSDAEVIGTIYIRADGSIEPATAPIQGNGDNYTLTGDIVTEFGLDGVVIERDNISLNGTNHGLAADYLLPYDYGKGISLSGRNNVKINNIAVSHYAIGISLINSSHCKIHDNSISDNTYGISLSNSHFNVITTSSLSNAGSSRIRGINILLDGSSNNNVYKNNLTTCSTSWYVGGIWLSSSFNNTIAENNMSGNNEAIRLTSSEGNVFSGNNITNNYRGIEAFSSSKNVVFQNTIMANSEYGLLFDHSSNDAVYHNNLISNAMQVYIQQSANAWNNCVEGNFWSDYAGVDFDHDGIGDTAYEIDANNTDKFPLVGIFSSFNTTLGIHANVISNSTVEDFEYSKSNGAIIMHVSNMTENQTFGFVRICIPHALMNDTYQVTIDDAEPYYVNHTLYDNSTHRWIYFAYEHSTLEVVIVPELSSFLILPLFTIATLLAALVYRRKRVPPSRE